MANPFTLPMIGASLIGAAFVGLQLGEGAIGMINPIHFQGPALHPRDRGVAIDEPLPAPVRPAYSQLYGWEEGEVARAVACGACDASFAADSEYSAVAPYFGEPAYQEDEAALAALPPLPDGDDRRAAREANIARYAYFETEAPVVEARQMEVATVSEMSADQPVEAEIALY